MAREAYFVLDCSLYTDSIAEVISAFHRIGWSDPGDQKEFLPLHDEEDGFNWERQPLTAEELLSLVSEKQKCGDFTDASWYIEQIAAKLEETGCIIQSVEYSEIIG